MTNSCVPTIVWVNKCSTMIFCRFIIKCGDVLFDSQSTNTSTSWCTSSLTMGLRASHTKEGGGCTGPQTPRQTNEVNKCCCHKGQAPFEQTVDGQNHTQPHTHTPTHTHEDDAKRPNPSTSKSTRRLESPISLKVSVVCISQSTVVHLKFAPYWFRIPATRSRCPGLLAGPWHVSIRGGWECISGRALEAVWLVSTVKTSLGRYSANASRVHLV